MRNLWTWPAALVIALAWSVGCNTGSDTANSQRSEPGAEGTSGGAAGETTLTGCLERDIDTGRFVLVVRGDASPDAGLQSASEPIVLLKANDDVELNRDIGKQVTLRGTLGRIDAITDAGTEAPVAGRGADPSQTGERDTRGMRVSRVESVGDTCDLSAR